MVSSIPLETFFIWVVHWDESKVSFGGSSSYHLGTERLNTAALKNWDFLPLLGDWKAGVRSRSAQVSEAVHRDHTARGFTELPVDSHSWYCILYQPLKVRTKAMEDLICSGPTVVLRCCFLLRALLSFVRSLTGLDFSCVIEKQNQNILPLLFTEYFSF